MHKRRYLMGGVFVIIFLSTMIWLKSEFTVFVRDLLLPYKTYTNLSNAVYDENVIKWCDLPLSHHLDQGGIPFDYQDITHPSIAYIPEGFAGHKYWMAATPYPQTLPTSGEPYENTCIFYANENENDEAPTKFHPIKKNPIIYVEDGYFNSDSEIFYDSADSILYAFTRRHVKEGYDIFIQYSRDGEEWSKPNCILKSKTHSLCPVVLKNKDKYLMYTFEYDSSSNKLKSTYFDVYESESLSNPVFKHKHRVDWTADSNFWHGDIFEYNGKFYMLYCGTNNTYNYFWGSGDCHRYMWLAVSNDGLNFTHFERPILKYNDVYRSTLTISDDRFIAYFSTLQRYYGDSAYPAGNRIGKIELKLSDILKNLDSK